MHPPTPNDSSRRGRLFLVVLVLAVGLTFLGLCVIAGVCACTVPPVAHGPDFDARFTVLDGFFYAGQPAKTMAYQLGCLATPFLVLLSFWAARRWTHGITDQTANRIIGTGALLYFTLMVLCAWPIIHCPNPPFWINPPSWMILPFTYSHPFGSPARLLLLAAAVGVEGYFLIVGPSRRNLNYALFVLLLIWALLIPSRFYTPGEIDDGPRFVYTLNSVLDALSQSVDGHHVLIDFPHIYGAYGEILAPFIRLFPREIGTLIVALAVPHVMSMLCQLLLARMIIRNPAMLFLSGMTLLAVGYMISSDEIYYGYLTARLFFPPLGLLAAAFYFRRPSLPLYVVTTAIATVASIWNLDTGLVLWGSWLGTLLTLNLARADFNGAIRQLLVQALSLLATSTAFFLYLRLASGQWPDLRLLFYFQNLVVGSGYFCLRLLFPDLWVYILGIYVMALAVVASALARGRTHWTIPMMLMISFLGIGIFSYFMGRSAPPNLVLVSYPAVLLAGMLCARADTQIKRKLLPDATRFFLLPSRIALIWWTFLMVAALPDLMAISTHVTLNWRDEKVTPLRANAAFVEQVVKPREDGVFFLSNHSGFYYYLTDTVRPLKIPGMIELLHARDMNVMIEAIRHRQIGKLIVDRKFPDPDMYRHEFYDRIRDAISQNYQPVATGPNGQLVLYQPR